MQTSPEALIAQLEHLLEQDTATVAALQAALDECTTPTIAPKYLLDGEHELTLPAFLDGNDFAPSTLHALLTLAPGETYEEPAGGAAGWTLARLPEVSA
ncbi:MAG: hypothetical protein EOO74_05010 [Myxococcales bacterium]|nr:MAG: hypothetical protein EOO74_05010 [Myxococcales bacterium]